MTTTPFLGWSSHMSDTCESNMGAARFAEAPTTYIPLAVTFADPPPRPEPAPARLPKRLRRRAAGHLALAVTAAAGFTTALLAGGVI